MMEFFFAEIKLVSKLISEYQELIENDIHNNDIEIRPNLDKY